MDVANMKSKVIRLLGATVVVEEGLSESVPASPIHSEVYSSDLLIDGINAALDAICVKIWKPSLIVILGPLGVPDEGLGITQISSIGMTSPQGPIGTVKALLPTDLIDIESVWSFQYGTFIPKIPLAIHHALENVWANSWFLYPHGYITFSMDLSATEKMTVFYSAYWTHITEADETTELSGESVQLEPPNLANEAIALYAASYCLINQANQAASIRTYNTKVDSGTPTQNPAKEMSQYLLQRYQYELDKLPKMDKGDVLGPLTG